MTKKKRCSKLKIRNWLMYDKLNVNRKSEVDWCMISSMLTENQKLTVVWSQNYRWQNGKVRFLIRLHLKVALPNRIEESSSRREGSRRRQIAKFLISCLAKFSSNLAKFKIVLSKFCETQNFEKIILNFAKCGKIFCETQNKKSLQPPYVGV